MKKKILSSVLAAGIFANVANAYFLPTFKKGTTFGIQAKSVNFDKLNVKEKTAYGLYYGVVWDLGKPAAWGIKLNFEVDYAKMKDSDDKDFTYTDYYAILAPSYTFVFDSSNLRVYAGGKFGFVDMENTSNPSYGVVGGVEFNYKRLNLGVEYMSGTMTMKSGDYKISEATGYLGFNF
ncbi:hypothetical protein [Caminibacter sp.]